MIISLSTGQITIIILINESLRIPLYNLHYFLYATEKCFPIIVLLSF